MANIDPKDARQGKKGQPILIVLVAALALAVIAFIGMGFYGGSLPDENIGTPEEAGVSTEPATPAETPAGGAPAGVVTPEEAPAAPPPAN